MQVVGRRLMLELCPDLATVVRFQERANSLRGSAPCTFFPVHSPPCRIFAFMRGQFMLHARLPCYQDASAGDCLPSLG